VSADIVSLVVAELLYLLNGCVVNFSAFSVLVNLGKGVTMECSTTWYPFTTVLVQAKG